MPADALPEVYALSLRGPGDGCRPATLTVWDPDPDDPALVRLELRHAGGHLRRRGAVLFLVLGALRRELEAAGLLMECYGASRNVYPSGMSLDMGGGRRAYKLTLGQPGRLRDLVDVFATGPGVAPATVEEQEAFYARWCASLGARDAP
jgi:hypothetical protein